MLFHCAVVVSYYRNNAVVETEYRHTNKAVELKECAENIDGKLLAESVCN